ncbi:MAG TPA: hypothetical protein PLG99_06060 [Kaistiaceae bacterium]|nr:hypothetical protein [Kaistiaceae bacterium]
MGGEATTSRVGSSTSRPSFWLHLNTRTWASMGFRPSLRRVMVPVAPGAGTSTMTGATWSEAALAGRVVAASMASEIAVIQVRVKVMDLYLGLSDCGLPDAVSR